jgi:hypothetical protein
VICGRRAVILLAVTGRGMKWTAAALASVAAAAFTIRLVGAHWPDLGPSFPDSKSFLRVAERGPFDARFWFDERPAGYPLLLWVVGREAQAAVLAQSVLYAAAFAVTCAAVFHLLKSRVLAAAAAAAIVAIGVQSRFALWNTVLLSEALSHSTGVASLAAWWAFAARPRPRMLWCAVALTAAWTLTRDSNAAPVLAAAVPTLLVAAAAWRGAGPGLRRAMPAAAAVLAVACAYVAVAQDVSDRNHWPVMNNVGKRILLDPEMTGWFVAGGMPLDYALLEYTRKSSFDDQFRMLRDERLEAFRQWARDEGQRRQLLSFVVKADYWLGRLRADLPRILASDQRGYDVYSVAQRLPAGVPLIGGPRTPGALAAWVTIALVALAAAAAEPRTRVAATVTAVALASCAVDAYVSYVGDAMEFERHLTGATLRLPIVAVVAVALALDRFGRASARGGEAAAAAGRGARETG